MNHTLKKSLHAALAAGCALAFAAHADTQPSPNAKPKVMTPTHWVKAASKHNGSGIRLRYSVPASVPLNQAATVQLEFSGVVSDDAVAELRPPEGATLVSSEGAPVSRMALPRGQVTTLSLRVTPSVDGEQTLDVFTTQAQRSSAQSVPLKVGKGERALKPSGTAQTTPSGEKVISLPAQPR